MNNLAVHETVNMLVTEVARRVSEVGTTPAALTQLSQKLLSEMQIPLSPDARTEFTQALESMEGMSTDEIQARVVDLLTPEKSPALFGAVFAAN